MHHGKGNTVNILIEKKQTHQTCLFLARRPSSYVQMDPLVAFQVTFLGEAFATGQAAVRSLSCVNPSVGLEVAQLGEAAPTEGAAERPLTCVSLQVGLQVAGVGEALPTLAAAQEVPGASDGVGVRVG